VLSFVNSIFEKMLALPLFPGSLINHLKNYILFNNIRDSQYLLGFVKGGSINSIQAKLFISSFNKG